MSVINDLVQIKKTLNKLNKELKWVGPKTSNRRATCELNKFRPKEILFMIRDGEGGMVDLTKEELMSLAKWANSLEERKKK